MDIVSKIVAFVTGLISFILGLLPLFAVAVPFLIEVRLDKDTVVENDKKVVKKNLRWDVSVRRSIAVMAIKWTFKRAFPNLSISRMEKPATKKEVTKKK